MAANESQTVVLSNTALCVEIERASGCFAVVDQATGVRWRGDPWFGSAGEVVLEEGAGGRRLACDLSKARGVEVRAEGNGARVRFTGLQAAGGELAQSEVRATVELLGDAPELRVTLERVAFDERRFRLVHVEYPARFGALESFVDLGAVVLPHWEGALLPTRRVVLSPLDLWMYEDATRSAAAMNDIPFPTMPWFGAYLDRAGQADQVEHAGFVCIVETPDDLQLRTIANGALQQRYDVRGEVSPLMHVAAASPLWLGSRGGLGYARMARYRFGAGLDYVAMAKHYRAYARATGTFKSLREKAAERPALARLAGAPNLAIYAGYPHYAPGVHPAYATYRYKDVAAAVRDLAGTLGLPRAFVHFWGGYSQQPPGA